MSSGAGSPGLDIDEVLAILSRPDDADLLEILELVASICDSESAGITIRRGGAHGGRVGAEPVPGGGTEIWFELPDGGTDQEVVG